MKEWVFWAVVLLVYTLASVAQWTVRFPRCLACWHIVLNKKRAEKRDSRRVAARLACKGWRFKDWTPTDPPYPRPSGPPPSNS